MIEVSLLSARQKLRHLAQRVHENVQGVAAVEFAMIAPVLLMMLMGSIEYSQAITVDRRVTQAASVTADLVARAPSEGVTAAQIDRDLAIVGQLLAPYDTAPLTLNIISIKAKADPNNPDAVIYVVDWSRDNRGGTPYQRNSPPPFGMPDGLLVAGDSVIVGFARYTYIPLSVRYFIKTGIELEQKFYLKPRNSNCVHLKPINCVTGETMS